MGRFSSDLYTIDDSLPFFVNILLAKCFTLLGITVVLCIVQVGICNLFDFFLFI